jgi:predicted  nucleic acid-binding Zn-ribbon protein
MVNGFNHGTITFRLMLIRPIWTLEETLEIDYGMLRTVHRLLRQIADVGERIEKGPKKVKLVQQNELKFQQAVDASKETLTQTKMAADAKQLQLGEREAAIEKMKANLNTCSSNKEFQLLKDRIAADEQANSVLSDEILELLERIDVLTEELATARANHEKAQGETRAMQESVSSELETLTRELTELKAELVEQEKLIPTDLKVDYRRLVDKKGENALTETDAQTCGFCNQRMTTQTAAELLMKKALFCKGCGCLLYPVLNHPASK